VGRGNGAVLAELGHPGDAAYRYGDSVIVAGGRRDGHLDLPRVLCLHVDDASARHIALDCADVNRAATRDADEQRDPATWMLLQYADQADAARSQALTHLDDFLTGDLLTAPTPGLVVNARAGGAGGVRIRLAAQRRRPGRGEHCLLGSLDAATVLASSAVSTLRTTTPCALKLGRVPCESARSWYDDIVRADARDRLGGDRAGQGGPDGVRRFPGRSRRGG
jgi:hypothetical protein